MTTTFAKELEAAFDAVHQSWERILHDYALNSAIPNAPASITTDTDRAVQDIIISRLAKAFPKDGFCAEETTEGLRTAIHSAERIWIIDPIDGTRGFAMKNGEFSVMIGFVVAGKVVLGVVAEPAKNRLTYAVQGQGCWIKDGDMQPQRCSVRSTATLEDSILVQSRDKPGKPNPMLALLKPVKFVESYSAGIKMAMVARGEVDLYVNTYGHFSDWDICAGDVLVTEAGGQISEMNGSPVTYCKPGFGQDNGLLATNGRLHPLILEKLQTYVP